MKVDDEGRCTEKLRNVQHNDEVVPVVGFPLCCNPGLLEVKKKHTEKKGRGKTRKESILGLISGEVLQNIVSHFEV